MINRVLAGRYRITEKVATGGMAEVYKAQDTTLGRTVAVKVMLPQYASDPTFAARFRQEAQAAANLSSPYIVNIYDWGQDDGTYFIIMEYIRGVDLKTAIKERGRINESKVAEIGSEVCSALSVAHGYDVIHRDIKPQNIMIQPDGNIKVMDFGIARAGNTSLTTTNSVLGTAHYVSPEQAQGKNLTPATDLYSLGIVLYEAVTGRLPFDGPDAISVALQQVNNEPLPPSAVNPDIDPVLEAIIMHAMEKDPENRFASASDMRAALNNWIAGRPVVLTTPGYDDATTTVINPQQPVTPAFATQTATTVMPNMDDGPAVKAKPLVEPTVYRTDRDEDKKPKKKGAVIAVVIAIVAIAAILAGVLFMNNCSGGGDGTIPNVQGMSKGKAESTLKSAGYVVGTETEQSSDTVPAGTVISQDPAPGTAAEPGTAVNLVISSGEDKPQNATVPDLSGMTPEQARQALTNAGFTPKQGDDKFSDTVEAGKVCEQDIAAGTVASQGSTVTFHVSKGKETIKVPNVVGSGVTAGTGTLEGLGLTVNPVYQYSDQDEGLIIGQDPGPDSEVDKGATVTIIISNGPEPTPQVPVPDVTGMSLSDAQNTIYNAGLDVTSVSEEYSDTVPANCVISYTPSGMVDQGSGIHLTLSLGPAGGGGEG